ncbi:unnamed protein product [Rhizoctonia solani]|uniref:SnoaL-like domain-containing protein n=1 Tax=Rhizoctonia solani TaxID=456999 RepID=A0A8H3BZZ2_9AGAM|nr:unnamed protein product [Rhizoctonia solani]
MASPTAQTPVTSITQDQLQAEKAWIEGYYKDLDGLDWSKWEKYWDKDAFLQVGNLSRVHGRGAIENFYKDGLINIFESVHHESNRELTLDEFLGLIYSSRVVSYKIKGDPKGRTIRVPEMAVIHKRPGENVATGAEIYFDNTPIAAAVQEVMEGKVTE